MKVKITDKDKGFKKMMKLALSVTSSGPLWATTGVHEDIPNYPSGMSVPQVAFFNEFGFGVPTRSVFRACFDQLAVAKWWPSIIKLHSAMLAGTVKYHLIPELIGAEAVKDYQHFQRALSKPPNAPSTVARKGKNDPLIDTEHWVKNIAAKVGSGVKK